MQEPASEHGVLVYLDGSGLPSHLYEEHDLATLEDQLREVLAKASVGEFDGSESGPTETTLFLYGPGADELFATIEPTLRSFPLCQGARVVIRRGPPGAPQREVRL